MTHYSPAWPTLDNAASTAELEALQHKLQVGLLGLGALMLLMSVAWLMLSHTFLKLLTLPEVQTAAFSAQTVSLIRGAIWALVCVPLLSGLGAVWQARRTLLALEQQARWPGKAHAEALRRQIRLARLWLQAAKIVPLVLTVLANIGYLAASLFGEGENPLRVLGSLTREVVTQVVNWLVLSAIQDWLGAVYRTTLASRAPTTPYVARINSWFTFLLLPLGLSLLGSLVGVAFAYFTSTTVLRKLGLRLDMTPSEAGLFSQLSGSLLVSAVLGAVWCVLCMMLLTWSRQWAGRISQRLDSHLTAQDVPTPQMTGAVRRVGF